MQLPLLQNLFVDTSHEVRYSSIFALPAILTRLSPKRRRQMALETIVPMSTDESAKVRSTTLEILGEVIYTFYDETSPDDSQSANDETKTVYGAEEDEALDDLVRMFLGKRKEDRRVRDGQQQPLPTPHREMPEFEPDKDKARDYFYTDPTRPLVVAFNFPAVALTLGRGRWAELRESYLALARNPAVNVRRSLVASLGELAKIVGPENAKRDLIGVWRDAARSEEEVRGKAVQCLEVFVGALADPDRVDVVRDIWNVWQYGGWKGWREREGLARSLKGIVGLLLGNSDREALMLVRSLLRFALWDAVSAVREAGVEAVRGFLTCALCYLLRKLTIFFLLLASRDMVDAQGPPRSS